MRAYKLLLDFLGDMQLLSPSWKTQNIFPIYFKQYIYKYFKKHCSFHNISTNYSETVFHSFHNYIYKQFENCISFFLHYMSKSCLCFSSQTQAALSFTKHFLYKRIRLRTLGEARLCNKNLFIRASLLARRAFVS